MFNQIFLFQVASTFLQILSWLGDDDISWIVNVEGVQSSWGGNKNGIYQVNHAEEDVNKLETIFQRIKNCESGRNFGPGPHDSSFLNYFLFAIWILLRLWHQKFQTNPKVPQKSNDSKSVLQTITVASISPSKIWLKIHKFVANCHTHTSK